MKKTLSAIALALICLETNAQLAKGNIQLGGSIVLTSSSNDYETGSSTIRSFTITPRVGYFISDRAVIGLSPSFTNYAAENKSAASNLKNKQQIISFGPYYRYYFPMVEKLAAYLHCGANLNFGKSSSHSVSDTDTQTSAGKSTGFNISIFPGVNYFLTNKWGLEASFGALYYGYYTSKNTSDNTSLTYKYSTDNIGLTFGLDSFSLGVKYFITR